MPLHPAVKQQFVMIQIWGLGLGMTSKEVSRAQIIVNIFRLKISDDTYEPPGNDGYDS